MPVHVNQNVVILFLRCKQCGKLFQKEVGTHGSLDYIMLSNANSLHIHECSENMHGIAEVHGAQFRLDYDPEV